MFLRFFSTLFLLCAFLTSKSQDWIIYNTQNSGLPANEVLCVAQDHENNKWIGTYWGGVAKFTNTQWVVYSDTNSALPHYTVRAVAIDLNNDKWFGTPAGVSRFNGIIFSNYDTANSPLPSNFINLIRIDEDGNKWIGTNKGLAKFDGQNWEVFTTANSGLPSNYIQSLEIDGNGELWIGTYAGLVHYKPGANDWDVYNTSNSPLPDNTVYSIGITGGDNIWVRCFSEVLKFSNNNWVIYDQFSLGQPNSFCRTIPSTDSQSLWLGGDEGLIELCTTNGSVDSANYFNSFNSGLPNNGVITLFSDDKKNLWAGVALGNLAIYNPDGVSLTSIAEQELATGISVYPVPASDNVTIRFELDRNEEIAIETFDVSGRKVLPDQHREYFSGINQLTLPASEFLHGIYFVRLSSGKRSTVLKIVAGQ